VVFGIIFRLKEWLLIILCLFFFFLTWMELGLINFLSPNVLVFFGRYSWRREPFLHDHATHKHSSGNRPRSHNFIWFYTVLAFLWFFFRLTLAIVCCNYDVGSGARSLFFSLR
jgi:hypothetical protein